MFHCRLEECRSAAKRSTNNRYVCKYNGRIIDQSYWSGPFSLVVMTLDHRSRVLCSILDRNTRRAYFLYKSISPPTTHEYVQQFQWAAKTSYFASSKSLYWTRSQILNGPIRIRQEVTNSIMSSAIQCITGVSSGSSSFAHRKVCVDKQWRQYSGCTSASLLIMDSCV